MSYLYITDEARLIEAISDINEKCSYVVLDTETTGLDPRKDTVIDIQLSHPTHKAICFPARLAPLLTYLSPDLTLVLQNYKFDFHMLHNMGVDLRDRKVFDTMLVDHLVDENAEHGLDAKVQAAYGDNYKEVFWSKYASYLEAPLEEAIEYGCKDIEYTEKFYLYLLGALKAENIPDSLVEHVHRLAASLLNTEIAGVAVDQEYLMDRGVYLKGEIERLRPEMRALVALDIDVLECEMWEAEIASYKTEKRKALVEKPAFSFDSGKQLQALLYDKIGLAVQKNSKTKRPSVDDDCLEKLMEEHPVVPKIREYRTFQKIYTSYIEGTLERMVGGRIYPSFNVNGTVTGRISHSNPNLGQLPRTGGIRGMYVPDKGSVFISADYAQLEVCLEANITRDPNLTKIFTEGLSKHTMTAEALGVGRDVAKTLNFALQYWGSHYQVSRILGVGKDEALHIWNEYWKLYSGPKALKAKTDGMVTRGEPIVNPFGRKRRFEMRKRQAWDKDFRMAYNFLIQSSGADCTSRAYYLTCEWLKAKGYGRGVATLHDELVIEAKEEHWQECEAYMLNTMVSIGDELKLHIPLKAESSGLMRRWDD